MLLLPYVLFGCLVGWLCCLFGCLLCCCRLLSFSPRWTTQLLDARACDGESQGIAKADILDSVVNGAEGLEGGASVAAQLNGYGLGLGRGPQPDCLYLADGIDFAAMRRIKGDRGCSGKDAWRCKKDTSRHKTAATVLILDMR